jgi:mono/diheme cytochrome c family protein
VPIRIAIGLAGVLALASCEPSQSRAPAPGTNAASSERWIDLANDLAMLAVGRPAASADLDALARAGFTREAFTAYITRLLADPELAQLAHLVLELDQGGSRATQVMPVLRHAELQGETVYYLHERCDRKDAVAVKPWWNLSSSLLVCSNSYRPGVFGDDKGASCTGHYLSPSVPSSPCGCGPNLIRCVPDAKLRSKLQGALRAEHVDTIAYVVSHDLPIQTIFSSVESFRTGLAELAYQRERIEAGELASLDGLPPWTTWPTKGTWAPRHETRKGQHAGISTNHFLPQKGDSVRLKMVDLYESMWCDVVRSSGVTADSMLKLAFHDGPINVRGEVSSKELAAQPVCTTCHARLDYGAQFYKGMAWSWLGTHYDPRLQLDTDGPMYVRDIGDPRGTAKQNPASFIALALAQPEFSSCIARELSTHVLGKAGNDSELVAVLEPLVRQQASYRALFRRALEFYTDKRFAAAAKTAGATGGIVAMLDQHCSDCHDADDTRAPGVVAKHGGNWCKAAGARCADVALDIIVNVANETMPKDASMSIDDRRALIRELSTFAWRDAQQREVSVKFFSDQVIGSRPIHRSEAIAEAVHAAAPTARRDDATPADTLPTFGYSLAAAIGVNAARACSQEQDKAGCIRRAIEASRILK